MKKRFLLLAAAVVMVTLTLSCNNDLTDDGRKNARRSEDKKVTRGVIDSAVYIDFTSREHNANMYTREQVMQVIGGRTYRNGDSTIRINTVEGSIELSTSNGFFEGKSGQQFYAKFSFDVLAASSDCLYIRRNVSLPGVMMVGLKQFTDAQIPDLSVCLPLYGFSRNRIEVSSVMNGFIAMPSGTYWVDR